MMMMVTTMIVMTTIDAVATMSSQSNSTHDIDVLSRHLAVNVLRYQVDTDIRHNTVLSKKNEVFVYIIKSTMCETTK